MAVDRKCLIPAIQFSPAASFHSVYIQVKMKYEIAFHAVSL